MSFCDKAFSCAWLADDLALIGTKDNRLFELEIDRRGRRDAWREIELGREDAYTRNRAMEIAAQWVSRHTPQALRAINVSPPFLASPYGHGAVRAAASRRGGAHACSVSSTREHIVCSGGPSHNIVGFRRDEETECLVPRMAFSGHEDVVFDVGFIGRDAMASASRDCTVKVWQLPKSPSYDEIRITPSGSVHPIGGVHAERDACVASRLLIDVPLVILRRARRADTYFSSTQRRFRSYIVDISVEDISKLAASPPMPNRRRRFLARTLVSWTFDQKTFTPP